MNIQEFCAKHAACSDGKQWAINNCKDMQEVWFTAKPEWLLWTATRPGVLTDKELRLFAVWSVRQVSHLMPDPRSITALDVAERHIHGQATDEELAAAWDAARDAAWDAAGDAARAAARAATRAATRAAARAAAWDAAWDAAGDAARAAAGDAAGDAARAAAGDAARAAARAAAWAAHAKWLRENTKPNFN